jgi:dolichol kinase
MKNSSENPANYTEKNCYKKEIKRKLLHIIVILAFPAAYYFLSKWQMLLIIFPLAVIIILSDFYRQKIPLIKIIFNKLFGSILRQHELEKNSWTGASFMIVSALITFSLFPKIIAICAFSILAVSDCLAALVGKKMTSKEFFEKSIAGSIAFGISAFIILVICGILTNQQPYYYFFGILAVFATTIIEARPSFFKIDDNLTIPLVFACTMMVFALIWSVSY